MSREDPVDLPGEIIERNALFYSINFMQKKYYCRAANDVYWLMKKIALGLFEAAFLLAFAGPPLAAEKSTRGAVAEVVNGVVERHTLTLKLKDGTTRTFAVKGDVSLDYADDGDEVRVTVQKDKITSINVVRERK